MSAAADLDALIADFQQYGDLITTGDSVDRLQRVIQAFSVGTLQPPNDALGNDSMVWLCKLVKYLEAQVCPPAPGGTINLGPELVPPGSLFVSDGGFGGASFQIPFVTGASYLIQRVASVNINGVRDGSAAYALLFSAAIENGFIVAPVASLFVKASGGAGAIGSPVLVSVKQIL